MPQMATRALRHKISTKVNDKRDGIRFGHDVTFCTRGRWLTGDGKFKHVSHVTRWRIYTSDTYRELTIWTIISRSKTCACLATPNNAFIGQRPEACRCRIHDGFPSRKSWHDNTHQKKTTPPKVERWEWPVKIGIQWPIGNEQAAQT